MSLEQSYSNTGVWTLKDQRIFGPNLDGYQSTYFANSTSYLTFTGPVIGSNNFTVEFWFYPTGLFLSPGYSEQRGLFSIGTADAVGSLYLNTGANGTTLGVYADQASRTSVSSSLVVLTANTWQHIAVTKQGSNTFVHLNGASIATGISNYTPTNTSFQINRAYGGGVLGVPAYYNNFRLVVGEALYANATIAVPPAPPGVWANVYVLTCHSRTIKDGSSFNTTITPAGNTTTARVAPFLPHPYPNTGIITTKTVRNARMSNTYPIFSNVQAEVLIVAGGGGGMGSDPFSYGGGGGGAGGLLYYGSNSTPKTPNGNTIFLTPGETYTITIGAGGTGGGGDNNSGSLLPSSGSPSSLTGPGLSLSAVGGSRGGRGDTGGSGGGGSSPGGHSTNTPAAGAGTTGQGNPGGTASNLAGAGGGGAGSAGANGAVDTNSYGGAGGASLVYNLTGVNKYYAGGGGGSPEGQNVTTGSNASFGGAGGAYSGGGGAGIAGAGGGFSNTTATFANTGAPGTYGAGVINTGGGGGGGSNYNGGSGIIVIRTSKLAANVTGSPTLTSNNGLHTYEFTGSGTIRF